MNAFNLTTVVFDRRQLSARFWQATFQAWRKSRAHAISLAIFLVAIVILQLAVQVLLNLWNRNFFDALERRDAHGLWIQTQLFFPLAAASIFLAATSVWGRMAAQRGWRKVMSQHVIGKWLEKNRLHRLNHLAKGSENPEYRIAVDVRIATDAPVDMALAMFSSGLTAITFFSVLWTIGGSIDVVLFGRTITIPGYLVFGVIVYSGIMSILMTFLGHHLTNVIDQKNQSEAEFRAAVDAFREAPEIDGGAWQHRQAGRFVARIAGGVTLVARICVATSHHHHSVLWKCPLGFHDRLDPLCSKIPVRHDVARRTYPICGRIRRRPDRLQLARG